MIVREYGYICARSLVFFMKNLILVAAWKRAAFYNDLSFYFSY